MLSTAYRAVLRLLLLGGTFAAPISLALLGRAPMAALVIWLVTAVVIAAAPGELWPQHPFATGVACAPVGGTLAWAAAVFGYLATLLGPIPSSPCGAPTPR